MEDSATRWSFVRVFIILYASYLTLFMKQVVLTVERVSVAP
jgi:hypothetical protein